MPIGTPAQSQTACFSDLEMHWLLADTGETSAPAQPVCAPPRKRNRQPRPKPYAHTQAVSASPSSPSQSVSSSTCPRSAPSTPSPTAKRWPCGMPGCTKSYGRSHDLVRHLDSAHHAALACAADDAILAAGVPPNQVARVRELLARRNSCSACGASFSRRDALVRHMDEQGHRIASPPAAESMPRPDVPPVAPPPGLQWALVPVPVEEAAQPPVLEAALPPPPVYFDAGPFMSPLDMLLAPLDMLLAPADADPEFASDVIIAQQLSFLDVPSAPLLRDNDLFAFPGTGAADPLAELDLPSLEDWEALVSSWAQAQL